MSAHADILDERERLRKPFWSSLALHISVAVLALTWGRITMGPKTQLIGDPRGGGFGSVLVNPTATIPLPPKTGPKNPVANDTPSRLPTPPPTKEKPQKIAKAPNPDAIPIKGRSAKKQPERFWWERNTWREQQRHKENQLYYQGGQQVSSDMYNIPGGGGVGVGTNSTFGTQFGWYGTAVRDRVAQHWRANDVTAAGNPMVVVSFTIRSNGSVAPGSVKITQSSGNRGLDFSAQRAVLDSDPFQPLPTGFQRSEATVELRFELRH
jgi:protein TonB